MYRIESASEDPLTSGGGALEGGGGGPGMRRECPWTREPPGQGQRKAGALAGPPVGLGETPSSTVVPLPFLCPFPSLSFSIFFVSSSSSFLSPLLFLLLLLYLPRFLSFLFPSLLSSSPSSCLYQPPPRPLSRGCPWSGNRHTWERHRDTWRRCAWRRRWPSSASFPGAECRGASARCRAASSALAPAGAGSEPAAGGGCDGDSRRKGVSSKYSMGT